MQNIQFPVNLKFKISTLSNDFTATDANGNTVAYVRQKMFKLKEDIEVFSDETRTTVYYRIKADRWLDFSAAYSFFDESEREFGKIVRKGWRSIWKAKYEIVDQSQNVQYHVSEESAWVKVMDSVLGEIPVIGMFTGYLFNPSYIVTNLNNEPVFRMKKQPSFWGRNFELSQLDKVDSDDDDRIMLGLMMMLLLERRRG